VQQRAPRRALEPELERAPAPLVQEPVQERLVRRAQVWPSRQRPSQALR